MVGSVYADGGQKEVNDKGQEEKAAPQHPRFLE